MNDCTPRRTSGLTVLASAISGILAAGDMNAAQGQELEEITVTGSRILRRDLTAASPIVTIETQQFEQSSTIAIESVLNQMPQFVPAGTQFDAAGTQTSAFATPGIATVNLRGLGANRNLVLVDGRRAQPANATLVVNVNTIPSAAIERVETITGGASAVYGADALAGVVNFILKDDFEGVEMDFQSGITEQGDGEEARFSTLIGMNSADGRGNVMLGVDWTRREPVKSWDREYYRAGFLDPNTQSGGFLNAPGYSAAQNPPDQAVVDSIFADYYGVAPGTVSNTSEFYFNPDGTPFLLEGLGYNGPLGQVEVDGRGYHGVKVQPNGSLAQAALNTNIQSPLERRSAFGRAQYDIGDNLTAFVQANYSSSEVEQLTAFVPAITTWQAAIPNDGMREIPSDLETLLNSRDDPDGDWALFRGLDFLGNERTRNKTDVYQIMAGVEGRFPNNDWTWEAYVSTGRTTAINVGAGFASLQRYQYLVAQPGFGEGEFSQGRNFTIDCPTGLPIFAGTTPATPDPSCLEGIEARLKFLTELDQDIAEANIQGKLMDMPAGELRFAAGVGYRYNAFLFEPPEILDNVSVVENPVGLFVSNDSVGDTEVSEIYGELLMPATERLDVELGYRFSDYDTAGGVDTWKALLNFQATDAVSVRGGFQFATRAPNTAELFTGQTLNTVTFAPSDPCSYTTLAPWGNVEGNPRRLEVQALCRAIIGNDTSAFDTGPGGPDNFARPGLPFFPLENEVIQGNPDLDTEKADTWTLGLVLNGPGRLDNLVASVDFYNIEIEDAIAPVDPVFVYAQCFNADGSSNPDLVLDDPGGYCDMITRFPERGTRSLVDAPYSNTGVLETSGVDVTVNWTKDFGPGTFNVNSSANFLDRFETQENPQSPIFDAAGTLDQGGQYDYRLYTTFGYSFGGGSSLGVNWRYLPSIEDETAAQEPDTRIRGVGSYSVFNMFGRYPISDRIEFRGGVDNLLDEEPKVVGADPGTATTPPDASLGTTRAEFYDVLGRRYYIGFKMAF